MKHILNGSVGLSSRAMRHDLFMLEVSLVVGNDYVVCRPVGDLDSYTVGPFREALAQAEPSSNLLVDLSAVPFLDSTGLGALIGCVHRIREGGGTMAVCAPKASVAKLLRMTGFDRLVTMTRTLEEAASVLCGDDMPNGKKQPIGA